MTYVLTILTNLVAVIFANRLTPVGVSLELSPVRIKN